MRGLAGKTAVVIGGAGGIGFAIAKELAAAGTTVIATYRREESLRAVAAELESLPAIRPLHVDITDRRAVQRAADDAVAMLGKVHILCNSAGVNLLGPMEDATHEDWDWIMGVNFGGVVNALVSFLPKIKAHGEGGHVINVASMSSFIAGPMSGLYTAAKFAVRGLSESLRLSLAPHGIGVSLVCPGLTRTRIHAAARGRPVELARTAFPVSDEAAARLAEVHSWGMEASEVARKAVQGVLRGDFYVFTHPEFRYEVREGWDEIDAAFPDEDADPRRLVFEERRRQAKRDAAAAAAKIKPQRGSSPA